MGRSVSANNLKLALKNRVLDKQPAVGEASEARTDNRWDDLLDHGSGKSRSFESLRRALKTSSLYLAVPLSLLVLWELVARTSSLSSTLLPAPTTIAGSFWHLLVQGELWTNLFASLRRVLAGFALAAFLGIFLGAGVGFSRTLERILDPLIRLFRPIPPLAWIPLLILWLGIYESPKIALIAIGAFFPIFLSTVQGIRGVDQDLVEVGDTVGMNRFQLLARVVFPSALPSILTGLRIGLGIAWMCVVAAELIAANSGLGFLISDARLLSRADVVIVGMILIGLVGGGTDLLLRFVEKRLLNWKVSFDGV